VGDIASPVTRNNMWYQITDAQGYLRAELFGRETVQQTREFLGAVAAESIRKQCYRIFIFVHSSRPIFAVEKYGLSSFIELAVKYSGKIAILADSAEIRIAHEYIVMLARLRGVNVRSFREEAVAIQWLKSE